MSGMTLTDFLLARIAEDEEVARACAEVYPPPWEVADRGWMATVRADAPAFRVVTELEQAASIDGWLGDRVAHIARHDPARVLAECAAKRAIVQRSEWGLQHNDDPTDQCCGSFDPDHNAGVDAGDVIRHLASVYAGHPDYDEAWRP